MMNIEIFEKNKKCLKEIYDIHIDQYRYEESDLVVDVALIEERKILFVDKEEEIYHLDSLYNTEKLLDLWMCQFHQKCYNSNCFLFGLGNGAFVRKFLEEVPETNGVVIFEPSMDIFIKVIEEFDISDILLDKRVTLFIPATHLVEYDNFLDHFIKVEGIAGNLIYTHPNYEKLFKEEHDYNRELLRGAMLMSGAEDFLMFRMGSLYYDATFSNYNKFIKGKSLQDLKDKFPKGTPVIIVSAGPSLDYNIEQLRKAQGKCLIIAVDTALKPLLKRDIIPDIFVTIDIGKNIGHFEDVRTRKIPMIGVLTSNEIVVGRHEAIQFYADDSNKHIKATLESLGEELILLDSGGTVSQYSYALAKYLGAETIIFMGQDLAYTNGQSHSATSVRGITKEDINGEERVAVPDINGGTVLTSINMSLYLLWYERKIKKDHGISVIDATEGGAKIEGTHLMTLEAAIEKYCTKEVDWEQLFGETKDFLTSQQQEKMLAEILSLPAKFENLKSFVVKANRDYEKIIALVYQNKCQTKEIQRLFEKISKVNDELENSKEMIYVQWNMKKEESELLSDIYQTKEDEKEDLIDAMRTGLAYYKKVREVLELVILDLNTRFGLK